MAKERPGSSERSSPNSVETNAELVAHLEELTGRRIKSRQDITAYVDHLLREAGERRTKSQYVKNFLLILFLMVSAAQYYFIDVQLQILAQPALTVFVPVKGDLQPQRPYI